MLQDCSSSLKASVYIERCQPNDRKVIVKDFSHSPLFLRKTLCRLFLNREIKALKRLKNVDGIPRLLGPYGQDGFVMELIEGLHPTKEQFRQSETLDSKLQNLLRGMHKAGVTHNDVRMKNIIISDNDELFMIDYAASFIVGDKSSLFYYLKLPIYHFLKLIDESKIVDFTVDNNDYSVSSKDRKIFRLLRKMHVVVDAWKLLLKIARKR